MAGEAVALVLGIGQSRATANWVKRRANWLSVVVPPINFLAFHSSADAVRAATCNLQEELKGMTAKNYVLVAESQAAPLVVSAITDGKVPRPSVLVLLQPLGLNVHALGSTKQERYSSLMQRSRKFWAHKNQSLKEWGNRTTFTTLLRQTAPYPHRIKTAYAFGANQSIADAVAKLAEVIPVHVYAAKEDSLFPYSEIHETISGTRGVTLHKISGTHLNRATRRGIEQLSQIKKERTGEKS